MNLPFETLLTNRLLFHNMLEHYSLEQLNYIPEGFNNNIFWNVAHSAATMQLLVYSLSGNQWRISKEIVKGYRNGTRPEKPYTQEDVDAVKAILMTSAEQCKIDYENEYFGEYQGLVTKTGFDMKSVEDAIQFNNYHEGIHMGYVLAIRRYVQDMV